MENNATLKENEEVIEETKEVEEFQTLDKKELEKETPNVDLNKTTTKGLRITEKTKIRYNQAEKASGLSQEEFTNKLLDMCEFFESNDTTKNPELIELTAIVNRIPEIFINLVSKQKTYETSLSTKHNDELEKLKTLNEELETKYNEMLELNKQEVEKLNNDLEKVKTESELKIKEQELEIAKIEKEKASKDAEITDIKGKSKKTDDELAKVKKENATYEEKLDLKTKEIQELSKELQESREEVLSLKGNYLDVDKLKLEHEKNIEIYKLQVENLEDKMKQQKEMYLEQIEYYKSIVSIKQQ